MLSIGYPKSVLLFHVYKIAIRVQLIISQYNTTPHASHTHTHIRHHNQRINEPMNNTSRNLPCQIIKLFQTKHAFLQQDLSRVFDLLINYLFHCLNSKIKIQLAAPGPAHSHIPYYLVLALALRPVLVYLLTLQVALRLCPLLCACPPRHRPHALVLMIR